MKSIPNGIEDIALTHINEACEYILKKIGNSEFRPELGIVCGSGLGALGRHMEDPIAIPYADIPHFPSASVVGHGNQILIGKLSGVSTIMLQGRFHYYEGHDLPSTVLPIRVMAILGVKTLLVTNAAGSLDPDLRVGDLMVIEDHISFLSLAGANPIRGPNLSSLGPRFPAMTRTYHPSSYQIVSDACREAGFDPSLFVRRGVYVNVGGPTYETPSEVRFLRMIGGSAVGMSTVPEVIAAVHAGIKVIGISLISNIGIARGDEGASNIPIPTHEEVLQSTSDRAREMERIALYLAPKLRKL